MATAMPLHERMEAIKYITGVGELLTGSLLTFDAIKMNFHKIKLPKADKDCAVCGTHPTITEGQIVIEGFFVIE